MKISTNTAIVYATVVAALVGSIGVALAVVTGSVVSPQSSYTKTAFDIQRESAREIRDALARPIPQPERLPPMAAKTDKRVPKVAAIRHAQPKRQSEVAMREARQVFASIEEPTPAQSFFGFMSFGPGRR